MSENVAAVLANSPATYDQRRRGIGIELDPLPGMDFRMSTTLTLLDWCMSEQDVPRAVLDFAAGGGNVGWWAQLHDWQPFAYYATEQSAQQCATIRERVADASVCEWRCDVGGTPLLSALEAAKDPFLREYPVVLFSHGPEHHEDPYHAMEECWSLVRPGGWVLVVSARNDAHRSHFRKYTLDDLAALVGDIAGFGNPIVTWPLDYWADIFVAAQKTHGVLA